MVLVVEVIHIKGECPVYKVGDKIFLIDGYKLESKGPICMHSLASIMPYYNALSQGVEPEVLGLGKGKKAYLQCLDPEGWTGGGTVTFAVYRRDE